MAFKKKSGGTTPEAAEAPASGNTEVATTQETGLSVDFGSAGDLMSRIFEAQSGGLQVMEDHVIERTGGGVAFPILRIDAAGKFDEPYAGREGYDYPTGGKGFPGIILGWRFNSLIWPEVYKEGQGASKPAFSGVVAGNDDKGVALAVDAAAALQFTKAKEREEKFDPPEGPGAPTVGMEFLVYCCEVGHLVVVEVPAKYQNVVDTRTALDQIVNEEHGVVPPIPFIVKPNFAKKEINGFTPKTFWVSFSAYTGNVAEAQQEFISYMRQLGEPEQEVIENWLGGADRPLSAAHKQALQDAIDINPPRR